MAMQQASSLPADVYYPESDGEPMAESDTHWLATADLAFALRHRYQGDPRVYVASDNFIYYERGNPRAVFSPDVYVVFGVAKRLRGSYKVWEEEGRCPDVVFEISSRNTWIEDTGNKMAVCARLGVREYFLYDPERDYLDPPLQGYRLHGRRYIPMVPDVDGTLVSEVLDLRLAAGGGKLALADAATGEVLIGPAAAQDALRATEEALGATEAALDAAEAEIARLRAEVARLASST